jgi:adenylosuccinate synthase
MCDLFDEEVFEQKLTRLATGFQKRFGDLLQYDVKAEIEKYKVGCYSPMRAHHGG